MEHFFDCSPNYAELISTDAKQPQYIYEPVTVVSPDFARTLGMAFITGNDEDYASLEELLYLKARPESIFPERKCRRKLISICQKTRNCSSLEYTKNFPENSQFKNVIYRDIDENKRIKTVGELRVTMLSSA